MKFESMIGDVIDIFRITTPDVNHEFLQKKRLKQMHAQLYHIKNWYVNQDSSGYVFFLSNIEEICTAANVKMNRYLPKICIFRTNYTRGLDFLMTFKTQVSDRKKKLSISLFAVLSVRMCKKTQLWKLFLIPQKNVVEKFEQKLNVGLPWKDLSSLQERNTRNKRNPTTALCNICMRLLFW